MNEDQKGFLKFISLGLGLFILLTFSIYLIANGFHWFILSFWILVVFYIIIYIYNDLGDKK